MAINFHSFIQTDEWQHIQHTLRTKIDDYVNQIVAAGEEGNVNKVMHLTGRIGEIKELIELPEYLYADTRSNGNAEESNKKASRSPLI